MQQGVGARQGVGAQGSFEEDTSDLMMDPGDRVAFRRGLIDQGEARWLSMLADFDRDQLWSLDGQLSCVAWLVWRTRMARGTAFEKVRIAHELRRRPQVAAAFEAGRISYSAVRSITRLDRPDPEVDAALVRLAEVGTVKDLERAVRYYQWCVDQDRPPDLARLERRGIRVRRGPDGLSTAELTLDHLEIEELMLALQAVVDHTPQDPRAGREGPVDQSPHGDPADGDPADGDPADSVGGGSVGGGSGADQAGAPGDESPQGDWVPTWQRRADALLELVRIGLAHLDDRYQTGADRYLVHLVVNPATGTTEHLDGEPVSAPDAARARCDASWITHTLSDDGEPLRLGRKTRQWNAAQHRAVAVRDGATCRFPGCANHITDIHHLREWESGGLTDIDNGASLCRHHHTMIHHGYTVRGNANGILTFRRPDGRDLGTTTPRQRHWQLAA